MRHFVLDHVYVIMKDSYSAKMKPKYLYSHTAADVLFPILISISSFSFPILLFEYPLSNSILHLLRFRVNLFKSHHSLNCSAALLSLEFNVVILCCCVALCS